MAIDVKAWEGYRVVWLRPDMEQDGAGSGPNWRAALQVFLREQDKPLAMIELQPEDGTPPRFVQAVEKAVLQALALPAAESGQQLTVKYAQRWIDLINRISTQDRPLVLALVGYDQITNPNVHDLFAELLEYQPESLQILLISQAMPPLPLPRLRARRALLEVVF
jgi:ATP/maltotriose-dependent transcriptional regulator MalT